MKSSEFLNEDNDRDIYGLDSDDGYNDSIDDNEYRKIMSPDESQTYNDLMMSFKKHGVDLHDMPRLRNIMRKARTWRPDFEAYYQDNKKVDWAESTETVNESPISELDQEARDMLASDFERLGAESVAIANSLHTHNPRAYTAHLEEFRYLAQKVRVALDQFRK
jgi:hypothetical protein